jgi:putative transposase
LCLTDNHSDWGVGLYFLYLRNLKGFGGHYKRVYRIYRELELNLRIKPAQAAFARSTVALIGAANNQ